MNPFAISKRRDLMPERVTLPGVDQEQVDALRTEVDRSVRERRGFLLAMLAKGKPFARHTATERKRRRKTRHVRHMRDVAARSARLKEASQ